VQHTRAYKMQHPAHAATLSEAELAVDAVRAAGYAGDTPRPYAGVTRYAGLLLPAPRVCFITGSLNTASWRLKRYPRWTQVAELLHATCPRLSLVLLGTDTDDPINLPYVQDLRGKTTIREAAWILQHSVCAAANDTGLAHVAAAVNTPVVVAFGPTTIVKNLPRHHATAIYRDELACRPCHYRYGLGRVAAGRGCQNECMDIPPSRFADAIMQEATRE
jgi:ADP-heptose:LPS heptosyltransferase